MVLLAASAADAAELGVVDAAEMEVKEGTLKHDMTAHCSVSASRSSKVIIKPNCYCN